MPVVHFRFASVDATLTSGVIRVWSPSLRPGGTAVITSEPSWVNLVDGRADMVLEPGPVVGKITGNGRTHDLQFTVPSQDGDVDFLDLLGDTYEYAPEVVAAAQQAAREARQWALRSEQGADRVGTAEAVLDARDQATAAATTATGAAATATEQADRATIEADRAGSEADRATEQASAAAGSADAARADAVATAADRVKTTVDATATAEDRTAVGNARSMVGRMRDEAEAAQSAAEGAASTATTEAGRAKNEADRAQAAADSVDTDVIRQEVTDQIAAVVDGAPEDLDTIREVAEYAQENRGITDTLNAAIGKKADKAHTHTTSQVMGLDAALGAKLDASKIQVVAALPESPVEGTIYLVTGV